MLKANVKRKAFPVSLLSFGRRAETYFVRSDTKESMSSVYGYSC
jgi:hypothetical protein